MQITQCTTPNDAEKAAIYRLWNQEYPAQLGYNSMNELDSYLNALKNPTHYFLINDEGIMMGWAFAFERDNEKWFAIIVDSSVHKKGMGSTLLNTLKSNETILNGWVTDHNNYTKLNGTPYPSPLDFYLKNGFEICPDTRLETDKLSAVKIRWVNGVQ